MADLTLLQFEESCDFWLQWMSGEESLSIVLWTTGPRRESAATVVVVVARAIASAALEKNMFRLILAEEMFLWQNK